MKRMTRIRWNADERADVVRRAQTLLTEDPALRANELFSRSQESLPKERRRRGSAAAYAWLRAEVKRAGPLPSPAQVWRAPEAQAAERAADAPSAPPSAGDARAASDTMAEQPSPPASIVASLIEGGVQVLTGILRDPRVHAAVAELLQGVVPARGVQDRGTDGTPSTEAGGEPTPEGSNGSGPVLVAGCSADEARELEKEIDGALPLEFWAADAPREQLMEMLPRASLVIGVSERLSQSVESSLNRLGSRYVRHSGGIPALYRRLAELALR